MNDSKWHVCSWATQQKGPAVISLLKSSVAISPTAKKPFQYLTKSHTMHYLKELGQLKQVSKFLLSATEMRSVQRWLQWQFLHFFRNLWYHFCRCWTSGNHNSLIYGLLYWMDMKTKQGPLHVLWQVCFGCWVTWSISNWQKYYKSVFFSQSCFE